MRPGDDAPSGAISYGIASVFTPSAFRRNGYAAHMMRLLHRVLASASSLPPFPVEIWGQPPPPIPPGVKAGDALFSVLYSDVGPQFYKLCGPVPGADGWIVSDPWSTIWDLDDPIDQHPGSSSLKWLEANDIFPHLQGDAWELATRVLPANAAASGGKIHVAVQPSREQITFLTARYLLTLPTPPPAPTRWGAAITSDNVRQSSYIVWAPEPHPHSTLLIIRMRCDSVRTFSVLLGAAKQAARDFGLKHVEIWNTIPKSGWMADLARKWGGRRVRRSEHLPGIAWYGGDKSDDIVWDLNERYTPFKCGSRVALTRPLALCGIGLCGVRSKGRTNRHSSSMDKSLVSWEGSSVICLVGVVRISATICKSCCTQSGTFGNILHLIFLDGSPEF
jgi:LYC1 GNAT-like C-terminal domain